MGVKVSKISEVDLRRHKEIEADLMEDRAKMQNRFRLLLLGPGESGKSTIVKQMRILHTGGFTDEEIRHQRTLVAHNVLTNMVAIIRAMNILGMDFTDPNREMEAAAILKAEENWSSVQALSAGEWSCLKLLWSDSGVQECFHRANEYQLGDSTKYFCEDIDRIAQSNYTPTYEDILHTRASTLGIVEITFPFRDLMLTIIDVGGQRSQRKKWIHCFEGVNCLIYVASLSEYDQVLLEDAAVNRMQESLKLFGTVCNCQWFRLTPTILFLNKKDIFEQKLATSPLQQAFPTYEGDNSFETSVKFVEEEFHRRRENRSKDVYTHRTCATDTKNIEFVMGACFDIVLSKNMKQAGFSWLVQV